MTSQPDPAHGKVFSVGDIADYHDTTPEEVARVFVELLHHSPDDRFEFCRKAEPGTIPI